MSLDWTCIEVEGILNELTPQNLDTLVELVKSLDINTEEKLKGATDLFFEKAINEPNLSALYANMCKKLSSIRVPLDTGSGELLFRKLVLTKCQIEFELGWKYELKRKERIKATESADPLKELQLEFDEERKKMRMRQLGNIRFIGELFKLNMLIEPIIHECIKALLSESGEVSLECLCCLIETVGKELDGQDKEAKMDEYFAQMQNTVDKRLNSSSVRLMLQGVIDLRKNNWLITLDQIRKKQAKRLAEQVYRQKISGMDALARDLERLLSNGDASDATIRVKGEREFRVHRSILVARTPVFASMFTHPMSENSTGVVNIEDCEPDTLGLFLHYVYTGRVKGLSPENTTSLYQVADKYQVDELKLECLDHIRSGLSIESFFSTITLALTYSEMELTQIVTDFFIDNAKEITVTVEWQRFLRENPIQANELIVKMLQNVQINTTRRKN